MFLLLDRLVFYGIICSLMVARDLNSLNIYGHGLCYIHAKYFMINKYIFYENRILIGGNCTFLYQLSRHSKIYLHCIVDFEVFLKLCTNPHTRHSWTHIHFTKSHYAYRALSKLSAYLQYRQILTLVFIRAPNKSMLSTSAQVSSSLVK